MAEEQEKFSLQDVVEVRDLMGQTDKGINQYLENGWVLLTVYNRAGGDEAHSTFPGYVVGRPRWVNEE